MNKERDRSLAGIERQLNGMRCSRYELGIFDATAGPKGQMDIKVKTYDGIIAMYKYLQFENTNGKDIFIRPAPLDDGKTQGLILLDDLWMGTLNQLDQDGLNPAAIIQTSKGNYHAWIRVSEEPITQEEATAAAKILAKKYEADPASADWRHFGRLAGFANKKPGRNNRFVTAERCNGKAAVKGDEILQQARAWMQEKQEEKRQLEELEQQQPQNNKARTVKQTPEEFYQTEYQRLVEWSEVAYETGQTNQPPDNSRIDWMIAVNMVKARYTEQEIAHAIYSASPDLETRHKNYEMDYARRTARNAIAKTPLGVNKPILKPKF